MPDDDELVTVVEFDNLDAADAAWRVWLDEHLATAASLASEDVVIDTGRSDEGDVRRYRVRRSAIA